MSGSIFGTIFRVSTWGESHGAGVGAVIDGCPAGLPLNEEDIQKYLDRRKPGSSKFTTARNEGDRVKILSGVFEGKTEGTPISLIVENKDQRSKDYGNIAELYRPGHADYTFDKKYGFRDYRGGGRSSARETVGRVAAGAVAAKFLSGLDIEIDTYAKSIGPYTVPDDAVDIRYSKENPLCLADKETYEKASEYVSKLIEEGDSAGGVIECRIKGLPAGIGEPVFDKLDAELAKSMLSIGAVKGFELGDGFCVSVSRGSENNDEFISNSGIISKATNHSGGTLGGISDGSEIIFRTAFKPTPSISKMQRTVNKNGEHTELTIKGRHDPLVVPRAVVVVETMAALTVTDLMLRNLSSQYTLIKNFYMNK
ncbi:MAG: chorismate synthase [Lachnospiraceae bacterium]|nr:chorismate synthase [Lachnospiraceae bacterium]